MAIGGGPGLVAVFGLRKSWHGESERHSEAAKKGWQKRGSEKRAELQVKRRATLEDAVADFKELYQDPQRPVVAFNPSTGRPDLRVFFKENRARHACTKAPVDIEHQREDYITEHGEAPSREWFEKQRKFDPERAARIEWIGDVLKQPDEVWRTTVRGRAAFILLRESTPSEEAYIVVLSRGRVRGTVNFVTAYPDLTKRKIDKAFNIEERMYPKSTTPPRLEKACDGRALARQQAIRRRSSPARLQLPRPDAAAPGWGRDIIPPAGEKSNIVVVFG
jgi:hypothetical protein